MVHIASSVELHDVVIWPQSVYYNGKLYKTSYVLILALILHYATMFVLNHSVIYCALNLHNLSTKGLEI